MDIRDELTRWLTVVLLTLVGASGAAVFLATSPPRYQSSAEVFVSLGRSDNAGEMAQGDIFVQTRMRSFVRLVKTPVVLNPVIDRLRLDDSVDALAARVTAETTLDTNLLAVTATDASPQRAADIANAAVDSLGDIANQVQPGMSPGDVPLRLVTVRPAAIPTSTSVATLPVLAIGGFTGFLVGIVVVVVRDRFGTRRDGRSGERRHSAQHLTGDDRSRTVPEFAGRSSD